MYADERRLFAVIGVIIVAALLLLVQIGAARSGREGPVIWLGSSVAVFVEDVATSLIRGVRQTGGNVLSVPELGAKNAALRAQNEQLQADNARLREEVAEDRATASIAPVADRYPDGVVARIVGFPPENESRTVTLDRGSTSGIKIDDGVVTGDGVVGRVSAVTPFSSDVVLITDYTSRIPAIVRDGRFWGIAQGNLTSVLLQYVSQDARLQAGDIVVTGNGRSFASGIPIGTIVQVDRSDAALYQTAVLRPAVELGALDRVVVLTK